MTVSFDQSDASRYIEPLKTQGWLKIWLPGCGASTAPGLFARNGFTVWASDASAAAIQIQEALRAMPADATLAESPPNETGILHLLSHNFCTPFPEGDFDCILNFRSFQGLRGDSLIRAAQTHFAALRPGGYAIFSTVNVQGELRNLLEDALIEAGFHIPLNRTERWFRATLAATGIPYVMILGRPMPFRGDARYASESGQQIWEEDRERILRCLEEYQSRRELEAEETANVFTDGTMRIAQMVYNTG
jgi:SAM-dependent methyltransferase